MNNNKYGKEVFRKMLHMLVLAGVIAWSHYCDDWRYSAVVFLLAVLILFPLVYLLSKIPGVSAFFNARKKGEFSYSMMALGIMYAIVCSVCWGFLGERLLAIACIVAWGPGDAAAALIAMEAGCNVTDVEGRPLSYTGASSALCMSRGVKEIPECFK